MRRVLHSTAALTCLLLAGFALYSSTRVCQQFAEGLAAVDTVVDVGETQQGDTVEVRFVLFNRSPSPIDIIAVSAGYSCTEAKATTPQVQSSQSVEVVAKWSQGTRRGPIMDTVDVHYRIGSGEPQIGRLAMKALVRPDIEYTPDQLVFDAAVSATATVVA